MTAPKCFFLGMILGFCGCSRQAGEVEQSSKRTSEPTLYPVVLEADYFYAEAEYGGFYEAVANGYYHEVGLDVRIVHPSANSMGGKNVALGRSQFGVCRSDDVILEVARGIPIVALGAYLQLDPLAVMAHKESGVRTFHDLDRRTLIAAPGSSFIPFLERTYGIKMDIAPLNGGFSRFLTDSRIVQQCFLTNEPYFVKSTGLDPVVLPLYTSGFRPYRVWYSNRHFIDAHPDVIRAFAAATIRGWKEYMFGDRTAADALICSVNPQMSLGQLAFSVEAMKSYALVSGNPQAGDLIGHIRVERLREQISQMVSTGILDHPIRAEAVYAPLMLPEEPRAITGTNE